MFTIIVTGSRSYPVKKIWLVNYSLAKYHIWKEKDIFVKVGDCGDGADLYTRNWCRENLKPEQWEEFKANWDGHGKAAGPIRNHEMVDSGADLCIAFPETFSRGTKDCASYAASKGIPVEFPDLPEWASWAAPIATFKTDRTGKIHD